MNLPRAYRNFIRDVPQWSIRVSGGYVNHPVQGANTPIPPTHDSISVCKDNYNEYLYLIIINSCPGFYYLLSEEVIVNNLLIATITNKSSNQFEIININQTPI